MRKHIIESITQFIFILLLAVAITLGWVGYVYDGMPLVSVICFTIIDTILLVLNGIEYVLVLSHFYSESEKKDRESTE